MNNAKAIFIKQLTSLLKVPSMIIQGILFLLIAAAFVFFLGPDEVHECYDCIPAYVCAPCEEEAAARFELPVPSGVALFTVIFIGLALVGSASALVNEDKTTTNLRFMSMADVRPYEYLAGTFVAIMLVVSAMLVFYALLGGYFGFRFMAVGIAGGMVSAMLGIVIGLSKMPLLATPFSLILGLGPTFGNLNQNVANVLRFTFIQQVNVALADLGANLTESFLIIGANGLVVLLLFVWMHRKNRFNL